jgi:probable F420-dependent oxidoreductase
MPAIAIETGTVGVWSGALRTGDLGEAAEAAAELEELGFGAIWLPGRGPEDIETRLRALLSATTQIAVATGIISIWTHPAAGTAALHARLERDFPERFLLGLGVSHEPMVEQYTRPYSAMVRYLDELDAAADAVPGDQRVLAALAPRMLALARERTAGSHPYLVTPDHTHGAREALGPDAYLAPEQTVILDEDAGRARSLAREWIARYLEFPNYVDNLLRSGFREDDVTGGGSDRLVDEVIVWGDVERIVAQIVAQRAAGADHVALQVLTPDMAQLPREQWRQISAALR